MSMDIHIIKKKILTVWLIHQWILGLKHIAKQNIILKTYYALNHIVNGLNDGTYVFFM